MFGLPSWLVNSLVRGADSAQTSYSIVILVLGGVPWELGHVGQLGHVLGGETWKTHFRGKKSRILSLPDRRKGRKKRVAAHRAGEKLRRLFPGRTGGGEFTAPSPGGFVRSRCVVRPGIHRVGGCRWWKKVGPVIPRRLKLEWVKTETVKSPIFCHRLRRFPQMIRRSDYFPTICANLRNLRRIRDTLWCRFCSPRRADSRHLSLQFQ
jgi:hypothetical protein